MVRLLDTQFSEGFETLIALVRCSAFNTELAKCIRQPGGAERAVKAMLREFISEVRPDAKLERVSGPSFTAQVVYMQLEFEELRRRFSYVDPDYQDGWFDYIERYKGVSTENREVAFEYVCMNRRAQTEEVIAEMDRRGLRPAFYEELLGFALKYPDEQRMYSVVALGSEKLVKGERRVAYLRCSDYNRLDLGWSYHSGGWKDNDQFLAVRKYFAWRAFSEEIEANQGKHLSI